MTNFIKAAITTATFDSTSDELFSLDALYIEIYGKNSPTVKSKYNMEALRPYLDIKPNNMVSAKDLVLVANKITTSRSRNAAYKTLFNELRQDETYFNLLDDQGTNGIVARQARINEANAERCKTLEENVKLSVEHIIKLDGEVNTLKTDNVGLKANNVRLDGEINKLNGRVDTLETDNVGLKANNVRLEANNVRLEADNVGLKACTEELKANNVRLEAKYVELDGRVDTLETDTAMLKADNAMLKAGYAKLEAMVLKMGEQVSKYAEAVTYLLGSKDEMMGLGAHPLKQIVGSPIVEPIVEAVKQGISLGYEELTLNVKRILS